MPIPLIQTVGSTFCMYAGKTIHNSKGSCAQKVNGVLLVTPLWVPGRGKCKHKVQRLCEVDIKNRDNALACAALVQSSAWEVASRKPDDVIHAVHVSDVVASAKPTSSTDTRTSSCGADYRPPPANRFYFEKHVYAGIPRESDMVALKATQRFSSVKPLMVGIPVIGGPPVSTPSSSAVRGCGWCGLLSMPQLCSLVRGNADEACPGVLGHQPQ